MGASLALGTAAFGQAYGIKGDAQPTPEEVARILATARQAGIEVIDTAPAYNCTCDFSGFRVVQKTPFAGRCYALLQHDADKEPGLLFRLPHKAQKIGVSVYTPAQLERYLPLPIQIVQLPLNLADGRFLPYLPELRRRGIEIHVRSVFLQGALLTGAFGLPKLTVQDCLGYVLAQDVDYVVVGVHSERQLEELLRVKPQEGKSLNITDERVIDPRNWRRSQ